MKRLLLFLAAFAAIASTAFAQVSSVKGTVSDENGDPMAGVSVLVKGTQIGTVTDVDGTYTLRGVPANAQTLVFSFIGMETIEAAVRPTVNVSLRPDSETLDELVVVAYGVAKRESVTGAISTVKSESIAQRPLTSVTDALEGQATGVLALPGGDPGEDAAFRIRGVGSVNGSNSPLYVIDGVPFSGNVSDLNPNDIESLTVLKDATSAALYGNRASNGVILITTKRGKSDRVSLSVSVNQGVYNRAIPEYAKVDPRTSCKSSSTATPTAWSRVPACPRRKPSPMSGRT